MKYWQRNIKMAEEVDPKIGEIELFFCLDDSPHATLDNDVNMMFVRNCVQYANQLYLVKGCLFLNEFLEMLGLHRIAAGQISGWHKGAPIFEVDEFGASIRIRCWVEKDISHTALP